MPMYVFKHPEKDVYTEVLQGMNDDHIFFDEDGLKWDRVFTSPQVGIDSNPDPFSDRKFIEKTNKLGTYGDLLKRSEELSHKRAEKNNGVDPFAKARDEKYSKERMGRKPPKRVKDLNIEIKLNK